MNASHTPGPWQANVTSTRVSSAQFDTIANVAVNHVGEDARRANAALIAAAPELLAALQAFVTQRNKLSAFPQAVDPYSGAYVAARAAIAKATGADHA